MFKYKLYYDGGFLRDSADLGYTYETEEEAMEEAEMFIEGKIADWEADEVEYDRELFSVEVEEE